jgi:hypothetical protein
VATYGSVWRRVAGTVVVTGAVLPLVSWCLASPSTFAAGLAAACGVRQITRRLPPDGALRRLGNHVVATQLVDVRQRQVLRLLPAFVLAVVGWGMLLGGAGAATVLLVALTGVPLLFDSDVGRWPDGRGVGPVPDTVELLVPSQPGELGQALPSPRSSPEMPSFGLPPADAPRWPGPRTLLPDLDDTELLHAWEASTRALGLGPGPSARLAIVAARARYLDALAERDPDGMARRLAMGARDDRPSLGPPT